MCVLREVLTRDTAFLVSKCLYRPTILVGEIDPADPDSVIVRINNRIPEEWKDKTWITWNLCLDQPTQHTLCYTVDQIQEKCVVLSLLRGFPALEDATYVAPIELWEFQLHCDAILADATQSPADKINLLMDVVNKIDRTPLLIDYVYLIYQIIQAIISLGGTDKETISRWMKVCRERIPTLNTCSDF